MNIPQEIADIKTKISQLENELLNENVDARKDLIRQQIITYASQLTEYVKRLPFPAPQQGKFASNLLSHLA